METFYIQAHGAISAICTPLLRIHQAELEDWSVFCLSGECLRDSWSWLDERGRGTLHTKGNGLSVSSELFIYIVFDSMMLSLPVFVIFNNCNIKNSQKMN